MLVHVLLPLLSSLLSKIGCDHSCTLDPFSRHEYIYEYKIHEIKNERKRTVFSLTLIYFSGCSTYLSTSARVTLLDQQTVEEMSRSSFTNCSSSRKQEARQPFTFQIKKTQSFHSLFQLFLNLLHRKSLQA